MNNKRNVDYPRVGFKPHPRVLAITTCIALSYTGLSAQSKGFTDTVILKNGTVLSGVKATVTKDSLVVTNPEGETSVFTKKEVSEVKKGDAGNSTNTTKPDPTPKPAPSNGKWSAYQGVMNWEDAKKKCASIGMRLPTIEELKAAYAAGITESWKTDGNYYWSSTPVGDDRAYLLDIRFGNSYDNFRVSKHTVRCLR